MIYGRRYIQFNDLVIDGFDMIDQVDTNVSFKYISHDKSYGHGKYAVFKKKYMFAEETNISLNLKLYVKKLSCDDRPYYRNFSVGELLKPGKLWAVQNGELIWAYAAITQLSEIETWSKDVITITVDLTLPEGIWHKADMLKTFLRDYDPCELFECYDFKEINPCEKDTSSFNCCTDCDITKSEEIDAVCNCCYCDTICKEMALCYNKDRLNSVYDKCADGIDFHIVYDCQKAQQFFGDDYIGQKFCEKDLCSGIITGKVYANTDIPTKDYKIIIHGKMTSPSISINDNTNIIDGEYDGILTIKSNGDVYFRSSDCCTDELVSASRWIVPENNNYGWEFNQGYNRLVINTNDCCDMACAYIQVNGITI